MKKVLYANIANSGLAPAFSCIAWSVIAIMVLSNPTGTMAVRMLAPVDIVLFIVFALAAWALPSFAAEPTNRPAFAARMILSFVVLLLMSVYASLRWHRDFSSYPAQLVMLYLIICLANVDTLVRAKNRAELYRAVYAGALACFVLWVCWLMLMSWAIVSRVEPRWIESTAYNVVNGLIGFYLLWTAGLLRERGKRILRVEGNSVFLDQRDLSPVLAAHENRMLLAFLNRTDHVHTCDTLLGSLNGDSARPECVQCRAERWTASNCGAYRNTKNRIGDLKKYLELLQVGTIIPVSENPKLIKEAGWKLRFFDDVRFATIGSAPLPEPLLESLPEPLPSRLS